MKPESSKALAAFEAYYALGPDRSLRKLAEQQGGKGSAKPRRVESLLRQFEEWSSVHSWQARVAERDRQQAEANADAQRKRIAEIMATGYAQAHERVRLLNALLVQIEADMAVKGLWLQQSRMVGSGDEAKLITRYLFNDAQLDAIRGLLDDLAKETGGRKQIVDASTLVETYEQRMRRLREERGLSAEPGPGDEA